MNPSNDDIYDYLFKILLIGDSGVGKTSIMNRFIYDKFSNINMSTMGVDFKIVTKNIDNKIIKLQLWDTAGQERFRSLTSSYYRNANGIIIVFDLTDVESFNNVKMWLNECIKFSNRNVCVVLIGNKVDLVGEKTYIKNDEIKTLTESYNLEYLATSSRLDINIDQLFILLSKQIKSKMSNQTLYELQQNKQRITINTKTKKIGNKNDCC